MRHGSTAHTHMAYDVSLLLHCSRERQKKANETKLVRLWVFFFFTQRAAVSHEASGLQRSRLTGSFSQTVSEEETVKYTVHMTSCSPRSTEHTDLIYRLGGSVAFLLELYRSYFFIQEGLKSLLCLIFLLISQWMSFGLRLNHERKLKWSVEVQ